MNLPVPPRIVRRILMAPLVMLVAFWVLTTLPLLLIVAAVVSPFLPGKWRALRLLAFALLYLAMELLGLLAALGLWLASGFGFWIRAPRFVDLHYGLLRWALRVLVMGAERLFTLEVVEEPGSEIAGSPRGRTRWSSCPGTPDRATPSCSRTRSSASPSGAPASSLKDALQLDPFIDVMLNRLPNRFISTRPGGHDDAVAAIADLAADHGAAGRAADLPGGRQLHRGTPYARHRAAAQPWPGLVVAEARGAADVRAAAQAGRCLRRPRRVPDGRRGVRGAHRAGRPRQRRRPLARDPPGQHPHRRLAWRRGRGRATPSADLAARRLGGASTSGSPATAPPRSTSG